VTSDLDAVFASIEGALADDALPDGMRWAPGPETVTDAGYPYTEDPYTPVLRPLTIRGAYEWTLRAEQSREDYERALTGLREASTAAAEAIAGLVDAFGKIAAEGGLRFSELVDALSKASRDPWQPILPPRRLRGEDPRAYALALRQARGTGPDRQVQHRPRPRKHA
jgi:hypothetical protein